MAKRADFFVSFDSNARSFSESLEADLSRAQSAIEGLRSSAGPARQPSPQPGQQPPSRRQQPGPQGRVPPAPLPPQAPPSMRGANPAPAGQPPAGRAPMQPPPASESGPEVDLADFKRILADLAPSLAGAAGAMKLFDEKVSAAAIDFETRLKAAGEKLTRSAPREGQVVWHDASTGNFVTNDPAVAGTMQASGRKLTRVEQQATAVREAGYGAELDSRKKKGARIASVVDGEVSIKGIKPLREALGDNTSALKRLRKSLDDIKKGIVVGDGPAPPSPEAGPAPQGKRRKGGNPFTQPLVDGMSMGQAAGIASDVAAGEGKATNQEMITALKVFESQGYKPAKGKPKAKTTKAGLAERLADVYQQFGTQGGFEMADPNAPTRVSKKVKSLIKNLDKFWDENEAKLNQTDAVLEANRQGGGRLPKNERSSPVSNEGTVILPPNTRAGLIEKGSGILGRGDLLDVRNAAVWRKSFFGDKVPKARLAAVLDAMNREGKDYNPWDFKYDEGVEGKGAPARKARRRVNEIRNAQETFDKTIDAYYQRIKEELERVNSNIKSREKVGIKPRQDLLDEQKRLEELSAKLEPYMPGIQLREQGREAWAQRQQQRIEQGRQAAQDSKIIDDATGRATVGARKEKPKRGAEETTKQLPGVSWRGGQVQIDPSLNFDPRQLEPLRRRFKAEANAVKRLARAVSEGAPATEIERLTDAYRVARSKLLRTYERGSGTRLATRDAEVIELQKEGKGGRKATRADFDAAAPWAAGMSAAEVEEAIRGGAQAMPEGWRARRRRIVEYGPGDARTAVAEGRVMDSTSKRPRTKQQQDEDARWGPERAAFDQVESRKKATRQIRSLTKREENLTSELKKAEEALTKLEQSIGKKSAEYERAVNSPASATPSGSTRPADPRKMNRMLGLLAEDRRLEAELGNAGPDQREALKKRIYRVRQQIASLEKELSRETGIDIGPYRDPKLAAIEKVAKKGQGVTDAERKAAAQAQEVQRIRNELASVKKQLVEARTTARAGVPALAAWDQNAMAKMLRLQQLLGQRSSRTNAPKGEELAKINAEIDRLEGELRKATQTSERAAKKPKPPSSTDRVLSKETRADFIKDAPWADKMSVKQIREKIASGEQQLPAGWQTSAKKAAKTVADVAEAATAVNQVLTKKNRKQFIEAAPWADKMSVKQIEQAVRGGTRELPPGWELDVEKAAKKAKKVKDAAASADRVLNRGSREEFIAAAPWADKMSVKQIREEISKGRQKAPDGWTVGATGGGKGGGKGTGGSTSDGGKDSGILQKILSEVQAIRKAMGGKTAKDPAAKAPADGSPREPSAKPAASKPRTEFDDFVDYGQVNGAKIQELRKKRASASDQKETAKIDAEIAQLESEAKKAKEKTRTEKRRAKASASDSDKPWQDAPQLTDAQRQSFLRRIDPKVSQEVQASLQVDPIGAAATLRQRIGLRSREAYAMVSPYLQGDQRNRGNFESAVRRRLDALNIAAKADTNAAKETDKKNAALRESARIQQLLDQAMGRLSDGTKRALASLTGLVRSGASNERIVEAQAAAVRGLATDLGGTPNARQAGRAVLSASMGAPVSGREFNSITQTSGASFAAPVQAAQRAGGEAGKGMGNATLSTFEETVFGNAGFWGRVMHTTSTFIVRNFAAGMVFGATNALQDMVSQAIETQSTFVRISDALNQTGRSVGSLRSELTSISTDYGVALKDVYDTAAGLVGVFDNVGDIAQATRIVTQLQMISRGALNAQEAMKAISSITSSYGMVGTEALKRVADVLTVTQNLTGANLEVTTEGVARVAGMVKQMGFSFEETSIYATEIAKRTGQEGGPAAEQWQRILSVMQTGRGANALMQVFPNKDMRAALQGRDFADVSRQMVASWDDLTEAQQNYLATTLGGQRNITAFYAWVQGGQNTLNNIARAEGATGEADKRAAAIASQLGPLFQRLRQNAVNFVEALVSSGVLDWVGLLVMGINKVLGGLNWLLQKWNELGANNSFVGILQRAAASAASLALAISLAGKAYANMTAQALAENARRMGSDATAAATSVASGIAGGKAGAGKAGAAKAGASAADRGLIAALTGTTAVQAILDFSKRFSKQGKLARQLSSKSASMDELAAIANGTMDAGSLGGADGPRKSRLRNWAKSIEEAISKTPLAAGPFKKALSGLGSVARFAAGATDLLTTGLKAFGRASVLAKTGILALAAGVIYAASQIFAWMQRRQEVIKPLEAFAKERQDARKAEAEAAKRERPYRGPMTEAWLKYQESLPKTFAEGGGIKDVAQFSFLGVSKLISELQSAEFWDKTAIGDLKDVLSASITGLKMFAQDAKETFNDLQRWLARWAQGILSSIANIPGVQQLQDAASAASKAANPIGLAVKTGLGMLPGIGPLMPLITPSGVTQWIRDSMDEAAGALPEEQQRALEKSGMERSFRLSVVANDNVNQTTGPLGLKDRVANVSAVQNQLVSEIDAELEAVANDPNLDPVQKANKASQLEQQKARILEAAERTKRQIQGLLDIDLLTASQLEDVAGLSSSMKGMGRGTASQYSQFFEDEILKAATKGSQAEYYLNALSKGGLDPWQEKKLDYAYQRDVVIPAAMYNYQVETDADEKKRLKGVLDQEMAKFNQMLPDMISQEVNDTKTLIDGFKAKGKEEKAIYTANTMLATIDGDIKALLKEYDRDSVVVQQAIARRRELLKERSGLFLLSVQRETDAAKSGTRDQVTITEATLRMANETLAAAMRPRSGYDPMEIEALKNQQEDAALANYEAEASRREAWFAVQNVGAITGMAQARVNKAKALRMMQDAERTTLGRSSEQYANAVAESLRADEQILQSLFAARQALTSVGIATLTKQGRIVKTAKLQLKSAQDAYAEELRKAQGDTNAAEVRNARAQVIAAEDNERNVVFQNKMDTIDFNLQMSKITSYGAIKSLQNMLKQDRWTRAQRRQILLRIRGLQTDLTSSLTSSGFNIPTDIKLPTPYQVRRSLGIDQYSAVFRRTIDGEYRQLVNGQQAMNKARDLQRIGSASGTANNVVTNSNNRTVHNYGGTVIHVHARGANARAVAEEVVTLMDQKNSRYRRSKATTPRLVNT